MKAIRVGNTYRIYDETLQVHDSLPAQIYTLCFSKDSGFFLEKHNDLIIDEKIYGVHLEKVDKVLASFKVFTRNLGVILSGDKGIGKSLFAKKLALAAVASGYPVIIADTYIPGIASYLETIQQEIVVLFDEFDKTFGKGDSDEGVRYDPQTEMLTLFDGIAVGKKMFVITCNELRHLNDYLVNRPGRFHYHLRFDYPTPEQIREYLTDKLDSAYYGEIEKVIGFSHKVDLNYDCLRSIAFELSCGESFEAAIADLNIVNVDDEIYNLAIYFEDGRKMVHRNYRMDLFDREREECMWFTDEDGDYILRAEFYVADCIYNPEVGSTFVDPENLTMYWTTDDDYAEKVSARKKVKPTQLLITRPRSKSLHYMTV